MITINLAFDEKLATELANYLKERRIDSKRNKAEVQVEKTDFDPDILNSFLKKIKKSEYGIKKINSESYLISKKANVEDFGLATCEICGLVDFEEKLFSHRWTHGI